MMPSPVRVGHHFKCPVWVTGTAARDEMARACRQHTCFSGRCPEGCWAEPVWLRPTTRSVCYWWLWLLHGTGCEAPRGWGEWVSGGVGDPCQSDRVDGVGCQGDTRVECDNACDGVVGDRSCDQRAGGRGAQPKGDVGSHDCGGVH